MTLEAWAGQRPLTPAEVTELAALRERYQQDTRDHLRMWSLEEIQRVQGLTPDQHREYGALKARIDADIEAERQELNARATAWGQSAPFPHSIPAPPQPPKPGARVVPFTAKRKRQ